MAQEEGFKPGRREASATHPGREPGGRRLTLVSAVQDAQRKRRKRTRLKRLAAIVPVSDYRDVAG